MNTGDMVTIKHDDKFITREITNINRIGLFELYWLCGLNKWFVESDFYEGEER